MNNYDIELNSMEVAIFAIDGISFFCDSYEMLHKIAHHVGKNLENWNYDFEDAKLELVIAAKKAGFRSRTLDDDIDVAMVEGLAEYNGIMDDIKPGEEVPFNYDLERMKNALSGESSKPPIGLSPQEFREWLSLKSQEKKS